MKKRGIKFHESVPDTDQLKTWFPKGVLLVLDDLMAEGGTINGYRICSQNILTIRTSLCSTCARICFRRENMPRVFPGMPTTL